MPKFDEQQIGFIGGESVAWPQEQQPSYGEHWRHMHRAVKAVRDVVAGCCNQLGAIEDNRDLADHGRTRQLSDIGLAVIRSIDESATLANARKRAADRIAQIDAEMLAHAKPPEEAGEIALAGEIRAALRGMSPSERMNFIMHNLDQPGLAGAVTSAAGYLSGMSQTEQARVREMIAGKLYAPQIAEKALIERGLRELNVGIDRAHRLVASRARLEPNVHGEWAPKGQRVPVEGSRTAARVPNPNEHARRYA